MRNNIKKDKWTIITLMIIIALRFISPLLFSALIYTCLLTSIDDKNKLRTLKNMREKPFLIAFLKVLIPLVISNIVSAIIYNRMLDSNYMDMLGFAENALTMIGFVVTCAIFFRNPSVDYRKITIAIAIMAVGVPIVCEAIMSLLGMLFGRSTFDWDNLSMFNLMNIMMRSSASPQWGMAIRSIAKVAELYVISLFFVKKQA